MNFYRDENVSVITDTHFGRTFKEGVSLDRRGEYEAKILDDFGEFLLHPQTNIVVHAGDLFDTPEVNYEVLLKVYSKIRNAALENKDETIYYFIAGNHDLNKDDSKNEHCSFRLLQILLKTEKNVHFVFNNPFLFSMLEKKPNGNLINLILFPWDYKNSELTTSYMSEANYTIEHFDESVPEANYVIGHFNDPVPEAIANFKGVKLSGHFHKRHLTADGTFFVGSFYPIAFGEESDDSEMITLTLNQYENMNNEELKNKRVRILLKEGETLPVEHDCLQLIGKKVSEEKEVNLEVTQCEDCDFKQMFFECLKDCNLRDELWTAYLKGKNNA